MHSFQIIQVDVGQGDCTVIIIRNGPNGSLTDPILYTVVIDCGGGKNGVNDIGDHNSGLSLLRVLNEFQVTHIDIVNISHYDQDHLGGIRSLLSKAQKQNQLGADLRQLFHHTIFYDRGEPGIYDNGLKTFTNRSVLYTNYITDLYNLRAGFGLELTRPTELIFAAGVDWLNVRCKNTLFTTVSNATPKGDLYDFAPGHIMLGDDILAKSRIVLDGISLKCITANQFVWVDGEGDDSIGKYLNNRGKGGENHYSMTLLFRFKNFTHWLSGELFAEDENLCIPIIAKNCHQGKLSSMKAGHHGSSDSTSEDLIDSLKIKTFVISCGPSNSHGHPSSAVLQKLIDKNVKIFLTGWGGDPNYVKSVEFFHPFRNTDPLYIAGSSIPETLIPGDVYIISDDNRVNTYDNFTQAFFTQNYLYSWRSLRNAPNPFFEDPLTGFHFLDDQGDLLPQFTIDVAGSIEYIDNNGFQHDGRFARSGNWVLLESQ